MDKKHLKYRIKKGIVDEALASSGVHANSSYANFGPGTVNTNDGTTNAGTNNLFNSNGNENNNGFAVRPVDSIHCGYMIKDYIRDNIETNYCPFVCAIFLINRKCNFLLIKKHIAQKNSLNFSRDKS